MKTTFCIRRQWGTFDIAVIQFNPTDKIPCPDSLLKALKKVLTQWVKTTTEGKKSWEDSHCDFNIGDLSGEDLEQGVLSDMLRQKGIDGLCVEVFSLNENPSNWCYDTVLVNARVIKNPCYKV